MRRLLVLVVLLGAIGCEDDAPSIPRGGDPAPAQKPAAADVTTPASTDDAVAGAAAPAAADVQEPQADVDAGATPVDVGAPTADVPPGVASTPRLRSASELLGLGVPSGGESVTALPAFLRERPEGAAELLFEGGATEPSSAYAGMAGTVLPVSPLERQWGGATTMSDEEKRRRELLRQSVGEEPSGAIFAPTVEVEPTADADAPTAPSADDLPFEVIMFKLGPKGDVQSYERRFASREAQAAGERYARGLGFKPTRPTDDEVKAVKARLDDDAKKAAAKSAEAAPKAAADPCAFRASWAEAGVQKSMCFATQAAFDAFNRARQAAQAAPKAPAAPPPEGSIQPVKLGP